MTDSIEIGFLIYPGVVQLDVMAAYQVLSFPPNAKIHLISKNLDAIFSNEGLTLSPTVTFATCPQLDIICVPGGGIGQVSVMQDRETLEFLQHISQTAQYTTSICTGSLILATAGLLQGYQATCHWAFKSLLESLDVEVIDQRVVRDRDRLTGAGVTSGIDLGLTLLALVWGESIAKMSQLMLEYEPEPPFNSGTPAKTDRETLTSFIRLGQPLVESFSTCIAEVKAQNHLY